MNNEKENTNPQQQATSMPTEAEIRDIRSAVTRRKAPAPDVDKAWQKIAPHSTARYEEATPHFLAAHWKAIVTVAAACALLFFLLSPQKGTKDDQPEVATLTPDADNTEVTMTVKKGEWDQAKDNKSKESVVSGKKISFVNQVQDEKTMPSIVLMTTPFGKDCHITLSDGTRVWMNANSHLEFPERFSGQRRVVKLHGEAYFEVAKDRKHPFVVESEYMTTTVLGTTFNVRAYTPTDASVALVEGSVHVQNGSQTVTLKPNQQIQISGDKWKVEHINTYGLTQRKDGYFYFDHDTMREIMVELGRWYNKTIVFEETEDMDMRLHFVAERSQTLPEIINSLCELDGVDIELGNDEIVVK